METKSTGKMSITRRNNAHKEFLDKEKDREKSKLPEGSRKINGRVYHVHQSYEMRSEAITAEKELKNSNLTHLEKNKGKWTVYIFPI
jgi:hypothetical protein